MVRLLIQGIKVMIRHLIENGDSVLSVLGKVSEKHPMKALTLLAELYLR